MKKQYIKYFFKIGAMAAGGGPLILALVYVFLLHFHVVETLSASKVIAEILSSLILAFIAGGCSVVYTIENLSLMGATFLHSSILCLDYLIIYVANGWIPFSVSSVLRFVGIYLVIYFVIWTIIYLSIRHSVGKLNLKLQKQYKKEKA